MEIECYDYKVRAKYHKNDAIMDLCISLDESQCQELAARLFKDV